MLAVFITIFTGFNFSTIAVDADQTCVNYLLSIHPTVSPGFPRACYNSESNEIYRYIDNDTIHVYSVSVTEPGPNQCDPYNAVCNDVIRQINVNRGFTTQGASGVSSPSGLFGGGIAMANGNPYGITSCGMPPKAFNNYSIENQGEESFLGESIAHEITRIQQSLNSDQERALFRARELRQACEGSGVNAWLGRNRTTVIRLTNFRGTNSYDQDYMMNAQNRMRDLQRYGTWSNSLN